MTKQEEKPAAGDQTKKRATPVKLGSTGPLVFPLGFGCMGMSGVYGATDDADSVRTIQAAIDRGGHSPRYRRLLRHGAQRDARRPGDRRAPRSRTALGEVRRSARPRWELDGDRHAARRREDVRRL